MECVWLLLHVGADVAAKDVSCNERDTMGSVSEGKTVGLTRTCFLDGKWRTKRVRDVRVWMHTLGHSDIFIILIDQIIEKFAFLPKEKCQYFWTFF